MSKNKIFKKVTSCCLTLASVFLYQCHAFIENGNNAVKRLINAYNKREQSCNFTVRKRDGIQFCEFFSYGVYNDKTYNDEIYYNNDKTYSDKRIHCGTFYMSSDVLEREYMEFKNSDSQSYQKPVDENNKFIQYLKTKMDSKHYSESFNTGNCLYVFIINGKIENENLCSLIKNEHFMYSGLIYEEEIDKKQEDWFNKLGFGNNFQNNGYSCSDYNSNSKLGLGVGVLGFLSLGGFIAIKNASDSKISKKTNSISKKVIELAKSIIN